MGDYTFRNKATGSIVVVEAEGARSARNQLPPGGPYVAWRNSRPSPEFVVGAVNIIAPPSLSYNAATGLVTISPAQVQGIAGVSITSTYEGFEDGQSMGAVALSFGLNNPPSIVKVAQTISAPGFEPITVESAEIFAGVMTSGPAFSRSPLLSGGTSLGSQFTLDFEASGNPAPAVQIQYFLGASPISGQSAMVLPPSATAGASAGTQLKARVTLDNGIGDPVVLESNIITLTAAASVIGQSTLDGSFIEIPLPIGFLEANSTIVDPSKVTVTQTVPSKSTLGVDNTTTMTRAVGTVAEIAPGSSVLKVWMNEPVSRFATALSISADAGAFVNGAVSSGAISGNLQPLCIIDDMNVKGRIVGIVKGRTDVRFPFDLVDGTIYIEAMSMQEGGLACVRFDITDGTTTQTHYASSFTPSRYQDTARVSDAKWAANGVASGNAALAGLGVISSPGIAMSAFAEGEITITMTSYAKAGGELNKVTDTWTVFNNKGGYTNRVRYVDVAAGSDTTGDGLTAGTAFATLAKALSEAGAASKGAGAKDIPIVYCVGSGDDENPAQYTIPDGTTSTAATDTWLTVKPAPGHDSADTRIRAASGKFPRVRRMRFEDIDISLQSGNTTMPLMSNHSSFDATNPAAVMIKGGRVWHPTFMVGGNTVQGSTTTLLASTYSTANKSLLILNGCEIKEMARSFLSSNCPSIVRNVRGSDCTNDLIKGPNGTYFGIEFQRSDPPKNVLPFPNVLTGTPVVGETVTGLLSGATGVVGSIPSPTTIYLSSRTGNFKRDDNKNHRAILVADASAFQVGENIGGSRTILRKDGNTLRVADTTWSPSVGATVTGSVSGATSTVVSVTTEANIFFETSGARGRLQMLHADVLQVQTFFGSVAIVEDVTGTFQVGDNLKRGSETRQQVVGIDTAPDGRTLLLLNSTGTNGQLTASDYDKPVVGSASGARGTFVGYWRMHTGNLNTVIGNSRWDEVEGQMLFIENGSNGMLIVNWHGTKITEGYDMQMTRVTNFMLAHISVHQMQFLMRDNKETCLRSRNQILGLLCEGLVKNLPGLNIAECHNADPAITSNGDITAGDPLFVNSFAYNEVFDPARSNQELQAGSPARRFNPRAFGAWYPYDVFGTPRPTDGTAAIGAVEKWPVETSNNANLAALGFSAGTISPTFSAGTTSYTASVAANVANVVVTPVTDDPAATVTVNGVAVAYGDSSDPITLNTGTNAITVVVTASDGSTTKTYTNTITKAAAITLKGVFAANNGSDFNSGVVAAGDLIVVGAYRASSAVAPSNPTGYTSKRSVAAGNQGLRVSTKIAAVNGELVPVFDNAITRLIWVFSGATDIGAIDGASSGTNTVPLLPGLTMEGAGSYEIGAVCARGTTGYSDAESALAGFTQGAHLDNRRAFSKAPPTDGAEISAAAATDNATAGWHTFHAEVRAA